MRLFKRQNRKTKGPKKGKGAKGRGKSPLRKSILMWMSASGGLRASAGGLKASFKVLLPVAAAVALIWGASLAGASSGLFEAAEVEVSGLERVERENLLALGGLEPASNLLAMDLNEVASRLVSEPWVKAVRLERRLPNRLLVEVKERKAVAVVAATGTGGPKAVLVDEEGVVLGAATDEDRRRFSTVVGAKGYPPAPGSTFEDPAVTSGLAVLRATEGLPLVGRNSLAVVDCTYPGRIVLRGRRSHAVVAVRGGDLERKFARLKTLAEELKRRHGSIEYIDLSFERLVIIKGVEKDA